VLFPDEARNRDGRHVSYLSFEPLAELISQSQPTAGRGKKRLYHDSRIAIAYIIALRAILAASSETNAATPHRL
jgi:hypothetical protein